MAPEPAFITNNAPYQLDIDILRESNFWPQEADDICCKALHAVKHYLALDYACEVSLCLADNKLVQQLNHRYRGKNKPTNVLSFPQDHDAEQGHGLRMLGDIVLAWETLQYEADNASLPWEHHLSHLVVHGFLHLLGYDHETDYEAKEMETLEITILKQLSIADPYHDSDTQE
jgi:probable rRNA maturation factor